VLTVRAESRDAGAGESQGESRGRNRSNPLGPAAKIGRKYWTNMLKEWES
jgi:hypothetical protein